MALSIDTRSMAAGDCYVAIRGERHDGHAFVEEAIRRGAAGLILEDDPAKFDIPSTVEARRVVDTVVYLAETARQRVNHLRPTVVAITGSVGKTTTRRAVCTVLQKLGPVATPQGNWNTLLGISLTILNELTAAHRNLVLEVALDKGRDEIATMCGYFQPTVGVVTNVHPVHLEYLGRVDRIVQQKRALVESIPPEGVACLNYDDERVRGMAGSCRGTVTFFGSQPGATITPEHVSARLPLLGAYAVQPAMAAISVGVALGLSAAEANDALASMPSEPGRLARLPGRAGSTLIDDSYNASPVSTIAALDALASQEGDRRLAYLGDMLELGSASESGHRQVVERAAEVADVLVLVGPSMAAAWRERGREDVATRLFRDSSAVVEALDRDEILAPRSGDVALVKGSAGMRMERVSGQLLSDSLSASEYLVRQDKGWQAI